MIIKLNKPAGVENISVPSFVPAIARRKAAEIEEQVADEKLKGTKAFDTLVEFFVFVFGDQFTYDEFTKYADVIDYDLCFNKLLIELNQRSAEAISKEVSTKNAAAPEVKKKA